MRIMITGGTGMIGRMLIRSLLADGNQVWVLTRNPVTARLPEGVFSIFPPPNRSRMLILGELSLK
ncbi:MAG: NAD-dependent epimerase/dehydratase family protein [Anaerolineales bacterium]|nr:NAD-dependent epimerase/dehydratase family protein [Anaerolineales bacterium]